MSLFGVLEVGPNTLSETAKALLWVNGGRMIARKGDSVWTGISRFGTPMPPFDYNSGMDVRDIERGEAVALGVIAEDAPPPEPHPVDPLAGYAVTADGMAPGLAEEIADLSGGLVELVGGVLKWVGKGARAATRRVLRSTFRKCEAKDPATCRFHHPGLAKIKAGFKGKCSRKEARDLLNIGFDVGGSDGRKIVFDRFAKDHYERGSRRKDNTPKPENLELLPVAIYAVRNGERTLKFPRGTTPDWLNPPKGAQAVYSMPYGNETMKVFVYADSGRVSGWHSK